MHSKREINLNQLMILMIFFNLGGTAFASIGRYSGATIWITLILGGLVGTLFFTMFFRISKIHDHVGLPDILRACFGKWFGTFMLLLYACFFFFRSMVVGNFMSSMAQQTLMYGSSHRFVIAILLVTILLTSLYGLNAIARSSEVCFMVLMLCFLLFFTAVLSTGIFKIENLIPILAEATPQLGQGVIRVAFLPFSELLIFLMFFPYVKKKQQGGLLKRSYMAISVSLLLMIAIGLMNVAVLGANLVANFAHPFYNAMQLAGMNGFLERLDAFAIIAMVVSEYFKLTVFSYAALLAFQSLHKRFNIKIILAIIGVFIFIFAPLIKVNQIDFLFLTLPTKILPIPNLAIPLIVWVISEIQYKKRKKKAHQNEDEKPEGKHEQDQKSQLIAT